MNSYCTCCGKPLTDPVSVQSGMGPICALSNKNDAVRNRTMDIFGGADYGYEVIKRVLIIIDLNKGACTVTNDIGSVLAEIFVEIPRNSVDSVIYRDSENVYDGIEIDCAGKFQKFFPIRETEQVKALKKVGVLLH